VSFSPLTPEIMGATQCVQMHSSVCWAWHCKALWRSVIELVSLLFARRDAARPGGLHSRLCHAFLDKAQNWKIIVLFLKSKMYVCNNYVSHKQCWKTCILRFFSKSEMWLFYVFWTDVWKNRKISLVNVQSSDLRNEFTYFAQRSVTSQSSVIWWHW